MPRSNGPRAVFAEAHLAKRIRLEREQRGWSPEALVKRMDEVGCRIHLSALYKIEKGDPPRRITVDEFVGFSRAFGLDLAELLEDPDLKLDAEAARLHEQMMLAAINRDALRAMSEKAEAEHSELVDQLNRYFAEHPELDKERLDAIVGTDESRALFKESAEASTTDLYPLIKKRTLGASPTRRPSARKDATS